MTASAATSARANTIAINAKCSDDGQGLPNSSRGRNGRTGKHERA